MSVRAVPTLSSPVALLVALLIGGCGPASLSTAVPEPPPGTTPSSADAAPEPDVARVTCGGPSFDLAALDQAGGTELNVRDPAAVALRTHLTEGGIEAEWLPDNGWIEVSRTATMVQYVAQDVGAQLYNATVELNDGRWTIGGWAECALQPEVAPGVGLALFRIAPAQEVTKETTEIDVLVTEMACNSGEDARGRILEPRIILAADMVTVVMTVRPRGGAQNCPSNPETPFLLVLPEPLGDRTLLDGSEIPARDATVCPEHLCP